MNKYENPENRKDKTWLVVLLFATLIVGVAILPVVARLL